MIWGTRVCGTRTLLDRASERDEDTCSSSKRQEAKWRRKKRRQEGKERAMGRRIIRERRPKRRRDEQNGACGAIGAFLGVERALGRRGHAAPHARAHPSMNERKHRVRD